ncbi:uncharacterized protein V1518DRAFT_174853 [Limtongia smithiae]|uniref:uncharacterized protein n=1 Tax=Limtongia smithiae TaxID=1125753 RepID=UPI0034CF8B23
MRLSITVVFPRSPPYQYSRTQRSTAHTLEGHKRLLGLPVVLSTLAVACLWFQVADLCLVAEVAALAFYYCGYIFYSHLSLHTARQKSLFCFDSNTRL